MPLALREYCDMALCSFADALKVLVYEVNQVSSSADSYSMLSPHDLASADIVLTTYDTLQKDSHRVRDENSRTYSFRHARKHEVRLSKGCHGLHFTRIPTTLNLAGPTACGMLRGEAQTTKCTFSQCLAIPFMPSASPRMDSEQRRCPQPHLRW